MSESAKNIWATLSRALRKVKEPWLEGSHPLEMKRAILQEIDRDIVGVGEGKWIYPYTYLEIHLLAENPRQRAILEASLEEGIALEREIRTHLAERGCHLTQLYVDVTIVSERTELFGERRFVIKKCRQRRETPVDRQPTVTLTVVRGKAEKEVYTFDKDRIFVGRIREVTDEHGRPRRHNDIAFSDEDDDSVTVSRAHARIERRGGELWVIDERSGGGTQIRRAGRMIRVSSRDRRGIRLEDGDLIYFGLAAVLLGSRDSSPETNGSKREPEP